MRTPRVRALRAITLTFVLVLAAGCSRQTVLRPAPGADEVSWMDQAAVEEIEDVRVVAQANTWPGDPDVETHVTPVRVVVENGSDHPVRLRYQEFALIAADGRRFAALPPYAVDGEVTDRVIVENPQPMSDPVFEYRRFTVASYTGPVYPTLGQYEGRFVYDPYYYHYYQDYWMDYELPTVTMLEHAIPEGVVAPDGRVAGYLYFEPVPPDQSKVRFRADVVDASSGRMLGEVSIPFVVK